MTNVTKDSSFDLGAIRARCSQGITEIVDNPREYYRIQQILRDRADLLSEVDRLRSLINTPQTADFIEAVRLESAHQRERWGSEHDGGKTDADWFWLIGYLAGKALHKPEKQLHHIITIAAACLNWHAARTGAHTSMRPGIDPPEAA